MDTDYSLQLSNAVNQFSAQFYKETAANDPGKNLIMSPLSAEIVLALLSLGARGETLKQMNTALYLPDSDFTKSAFKPAIEKLNAIEGVTLKVANKVFVKDGERYVLSKEFKDFAVDIFQSEAQNVNFALSTEAAKIVNTWVEERTNNKIKDLIKPSSLDANTRLVLVNAIYFKGNWDKKFDKANTHKQDFFLNAKDKVQVDMMHKTSEYLFAELPEWNAKIIELPYEKKEMSMIIILPDEVEGLKALEEKLAGGANLNEAMQKMRKTDVELSLPKFKIETEIDLNKVLPKLGLGRIFDERNAEFEGLLESGESLYVSEAVQKAFIEVNEEGAEAAAATVLGVRTRRCVMIHERIELSVDRPFFIAIFSKSEEAIPLFIGRVGTDVYGFVSVDSEVMEHSGDVESATATPEHDEF